MATDKYQERYLAHQARKAEILASKFGSKDFRVYTPAEEKVLFDMFQSRCSQRAFNKEDVDIYTLLWAIDLAPSSCDRHGVSAFPVTERDEKDLLSGILVGGVGWIQRANTVLLLVADMNAYKSPVERDFMPYLDAGVIIQTVYLACEAMNYGCCFVNPNIREENRDFFKQRFEIKENELFCGALAIGCYDFKHSK